MVEPVERDARGILAPDRGLRRFVLDRHPPSPHVGRFVDRYWVVRWDLPPGDSHTQQVWPHPVVNVVVEGTDALAGMSSGLFSRHLEGQGSVLGIMFRPAGFRPLLGEPMRTLVDHPRPFAVLVGAGAVDDLIGAAADPSEPAAADAVLGRLLPDEAQPCEDTTALVERAAADAELRRVEQLAALAGVSPRTLQRRFADHVGFSPKRIIRRYRLYDAAERVRCGQDVDWATVAADLGYADQAHLTHDFAQAFGMPPAAYARWCRDTSATGSGS